MKPDIEFIPAFYRKYVDLVTADAVKEALTQNTEETRQLLHSIAEEKQTYSYAPGKWTIKDLVQHLTDAERIFCYRALRFARLDRTELPGFDENHYAASAQANKRSFSDLIREWDAVRNATILLFESFSEEQLNATGYANKNELSVHAIAFIIAGHTKHHLNIIRERYL